MTTSRLSRLFRTLIRIVAPLGRRTRSAEASQTTENVSDPDVGAREEIVVKYTDGVETHLQNCRYWNVGGCDCGGRKLGEGRAKRQIFPVVTGPRAADWKRSGDIAEVEQIIDEHSKMIAAEKAHEDKWQASRRREQMLEMG